MTIVIIRLRGRVGINKKIDDTLDMLRLKRKHNCVFIPDNNPVYSGMLKKVKDYVTYGKIKDETVKMVLTKRMKRIDKKKVAPELVEKAFKIIKEGKLLKDVDDIIPVLTLSPPKKGFEPLGIKKSYKQGGALSMRDNIDSLIARMV